MIQDLEDMNDEDELAGFRLCYLRTRFCGMPGGSCLGTPPRLPSIPGFTCPGSTEAAPQESGQRGASGMATAQQEISGLAATSCGSSK